MFCEVKVSLVIIGGWYQGCRVLDNVQQWNDMVEAEHAQTFRLRDSVPSSLDHWRGSSGRFRLDPYRSGDATVDLLFRKIGAHETLLDVGAGAGRLSLPLSLKCKEVTAVEPSPSMASALREDAALHKISNVNLVQAEWENVWLDQKDVVLCAHVLYTVRDIEPFIRKLEAHARGQVWVILFREPPQQRVYALWERVHQEKRLSLPCLPQFEKVLEELAVKVNYYHICSQETMGFQSFEEAQNQLRRRLFLTEGSPKDRLLAQLLGDELHEIEEHLQLRGSRPLEPVLASWKPGSAL